MIDLPPKSTTPPTGTRPAQKASSNAYESLILKVGLYLLGSCVSMFAIFFLLYFPGFMLDKTLSIILCFCAMIFVFCFLVCTHSMLKVIVVYHISLMAAYEMERENIENDHGTGAFCRNGES